MYFSESGKAISPWHDIPLSAGGNTYNFVCEIPKETSAKMECSLVRPNRKTYSVRHVQFGSNTFRNLFKLVDF